METKADGLYYANLFNGFFNLLSDTKVVGPLLFLSILVFVCKNFFVFVLNEYDITELVNYKLKKRCRRWAGFPKQPNVPRRRQPVR